MEKVSVSTQHFSFLDGSLEISFDEVMSRAKAGDDDIVILSGTLVEGIGNKHSDLDIYVITNELPAKEKIGEHSYMGFHEGRVRQYYDYIGEKGFGFDIEYYTPEEVVAMKKSVFDLHAQARKMTKIMRPKLRWGDDDALHKFRIGTCLTNDRRYSELFEPSLWKKLSFVQYRNKTGGYPEFKDIMGSWGSRDYDTSMHVATMYLMDQAAGLCHLAGITSSKPKWTVKNLQRLPGGLSEIGESVLDWIFTGWADASARREAVLMACDLVERIYRAEETLLNAEPDLFYSCADALRLTDEELAREVFHDPQTILEFEHRRLMFEGSGRDVRTFLVENA